MIPSFSDFFKKYGLTDRILAVGVSGGSDSLALVLALHEELSHLNYQIIALTVDHGLRPTSSAEAGYVADVMRRFRIEHHILPWLGDKPTTGIEESARTARYHLLETFCHDRQIKTLVLAHQLEDQAETFLMHLQRGSGLAGLCGMRPVRQSGNLRIIRPLLETSKTDLQNYLRQKNIEWIEDETNLSEAFLRGKIRRFLPTFYDKIGITAKDFGATMTRLQNTQFFLEKLTNETIERFMTCWEKTGARCPVNEWQALDREMRFRILAHLLPKFGDKNYMPRANAIMALIEKISAEDFKSATLGGCEILIFREELWFIGERPNREYSQKNWKFYLSLHPELKTIRLPYKMRLALWADFQAEKKIKPAF